MPQKSPDTGNDNVSPKKAPQKGGLFQMLGRVFGGKKSAARRELSERALQKKRQEAQARARERQHRAPTTRARAVARTSSADRGKAAPVAAPAPSEEIEEAMPEAAAAAPVQAKSAPEPKKEIPADDLDERLFTPAVEEKKSGTELGVWIPGLKKKSYLDEKKANVKQESIGGGFAGFVRGLFSRRPAGEKASAKAEASAPVIPEIAAAPQPKKSAQASAQTADLDALLSSGPSKEAPAADAPRALPRQDLMEPVAAKAEGKAKRAIQEEALPLIESIKKKELPQAQAQAKKPELPKAPEKEKPATEIVYKKRAVRKRSGFAEFIGAIKYLGLGKERYAVIQNLATMLNAGLPLIDSLKTLQMETRIKPMRKLLGRIVELVENGSPLWRAMEDQEFFSPHAIALVRIGEEAGSLAENMEYLSAQQEKDAALKAKVTMAMIYPSIVLTMMFVIVIGLGMFVLPNLMGVLFSLNVPLPLVTRWVIAFTNFFTTQGKTAVPAMIGGFVALAVLLKFTPLKVVGQWVLFKIPGIGTLARQATIARFGVILGGLLQAGVPLVDALKSLAEVTPVVSYRRFYFRLLDHITVGDSFGKSFQILRGSEKLLPVSVQQLVITGEKSGSLSAILLKIADIYEKKANNTAEKLPVILEPMILLVIGGLVGTIAFAIIVPIYSIVGNIGNQ